MCIKPRASSERGASLVEIMMTFAVSGVILTALLSFIIYAAKSFAGMENYVDLEQKSQLALDTVTKEIRETQALTGYGTRTLNSQQVTNVLTFLDFDNQTLTYNFTNNILLKQKGGNNWVLLTNVDYLNFSIFQRNPIGGTYDQYPTATPANCKLISVSWVCSRTVLGSKLNTESVQTAKIVIRKQQ